MSKYLFEVWSVDRSIKKTFSSAATLCDVVQNEISMGLRNHSVTIPAAVRKGDSVILICNYDMEGDVLYSVKWYKGRREFYRYTPKENPAMKVFVSGGITVEKSASNQSQVLITDVPSNISGRFSCEVSADAPSFHTSLVSADMEIVELPEQTPVLTGIHARYRPGDVLRGNCTSDYSKPASNLSWYINDVPATSPQIRIYRNIKDLQKNLESSILGLSFVIQHQHFIRGKLKLRCLARIYNIYDYPLDKFIEEDRPRILATGTSGHNMNFQSQPYDQSSNGGDVSELSEQNELYLTHYKAEPANAIKNSISILNYTIIFLVYFIVNKIS